MKQVTTQQPDFKIEWIKTLWELLQEIVEETEKWYSLHEFLLEASEEERKEIESRLTDADYKQFYEYMDWFTFVNKDEVHMACSQYFEATMNRAISMWESVDLYDDADDYIDNRNLNFDEDEADIWEKELAEKDLKEEIVLPF